jgi:aminoglycoside phosphotransferase (APT) family kinase protein
VGDDRATIRRLVGDVPVAPLGAGLDHRVYAVGDALVARFGDGVEREAALLSAIAPRLPLPVPVPVAVEAGCVVQPRVPGTSLLHLPRAERRAFVAQLVAFVDVLHALDPGVDVPEDRATLEDWLAEARIVDAAVPPAPAPVLIHGDLGAEHIFVEGGRITGVIDWGDAAIGDPGLDHGRLLRDFGPIGRGGERARLYAVCTALEDLAYGLEPYRSNALAALQELTSRSPRPG